MSTLETEKLKLDIATIEEQLRLHPPASGIHKFLTKDLTKMKRQLQKLQNALKSK